MLSGWFHDCGHVVKYLGHEEDSLKLAEEWLRKERYPEEKLKQVLACIAATEMPQQPKNLLEEVICDADLFHLSLHEYCHIQFQLREEFKRVLNREYTDREWMEENLDFLNNHHYFTTYGKSVLADRKRKNIEKCQQLVAEYSR
jgi:predicted metal-dependent HD superfamily phosphohydrolase